MTQSLFYGTVKLAQSSNDPVFCTLPNWRTGRSLRASELGNWARNRPKCEFSISLNSPPLRNEDGPFRTSTSGLQCCDSSPHFGHSKRHQTTDGINQNQPRGYSRHSIKNVLKKQSGFTCVRCVMSCTECFHLPGQWPNASFISSLYQN